MPPLPVIANVFRCTLNITSATKLPVHNTFHVRSPSAYTGAQVAGAVDSGLLTAGVSNLIVPLTTDYSVTSLTVLPLDGITAAYVLNGVAGWPDGFQTGDVVYEAAACVTQRTLLRGPAGRGRVYIGPLAESVISNGSVVANIPNLLDTAWTNFAAAMAIAANPVEMVVASYEHGIANQVIGFDCKPAMATQRRRLVRLR